MNTVFYFIFICIFSCKASHESANGCQEVTRRERLEMTLDPDRELQRIHTIIISHIDRLENLISKLKVWYNVSLKWN